MSTTNEYRCNMCPEQFPTVKALIEHYALCAQVTVSKIIAARDARAQAEADWHNPLAGRVGETP